MWHNFEASWLAVHPRAYPSAAGIGSGSTLVCAHSFCFIAGGPPAALAWVFCQALQRRFLGGL